jgi:Phage ABA sandwich domain
MEQFQGCPSEEQIIETLATKVMGWRQVNLGLSIIWVDADGRDVSVQVDSWDPLHNIADAWQVVEKFKAMRDTNYLAYRAFYEYVPESIYAITPEAICNAALKVRESEWA